MDVINLDRRPLAARSARPIVALSEFAIRRGWHPDVISVAGLVGALAGGVLMALAADLGNWAWFGGLLGIAIRALANILDGMVAVGSGRVSVTGELWNDLPDRGSDVALLTGAGIGAGLPWLGVAVSFAALVIAYVRVLGKACGAPSAWEGPMAKPERMAFLALGVIVAMLRTGFGDSTVQGATVAGALIVILALAPWTVIRRLRVTANALRSSGEPRSRVPMA